MNRVHLFEFEDLNWFPENLRNYGTDFLAFIANTFDIYKPVLPVIQKGIDHSRSTRIIDLASGGGGSLPALVRHLKGTLPDLKVTLTDYFPNTEAFREIVKNDPITFDYEKEPINAINVPPSFKGLRTMFLSFHHFPPDLAKGILQDAVDKRAPIAIFEAQQRNIPSLISILLSPLNVILMTPFIRPFRGGRLLFTYLIPIVPLFVLWDGIVSVLRTYSPRELKNLIGQLNQGDTFEWEIDTKRSGPGKILYLLGYPK